MELNVRGVEPFLDFADALLRALRYDDIEGDDTALGSPSTFVASLGIVQMFRHTKH